jgi:hypothetical protein
MLRGGRRVFIGLCSGGSAACQPEALNIYREPEARGAGDIAFSPPTILEFA